MLKRLNDLNENITLSVSGAITTAQLDINSLVSADAVSGILTSAQQIAWIDGELAGVYVELITGAGFSGESQVAAIGHHSLTSNQKSTGVIALAANITKLCIFRYPVVIKNYPPGLWS